MFVEGLYIVVCYCVLLAHSYTVRNTHCVGSVCYYLYEANNSFATWKISKEACNKHHLKMLRIESNQTQAAVEELLQNLPESTPRQVWIGGQRSSDYKLRYMNGTEFLQTVSTGDNENVPYCLYAKLCSGEEPKYVADNCDENRSTSRILCEYKFYTQDHCAESDSLLGGRCYRKTQYGGETNRIDWYSGQTYCSQSDIQGDIAYSYLDNNTLINSIKSLVDGDKACIQMWLGVRRRIWFWQSDADFDGDRPPIRYFNWLTNHENISDGNCIYIDRDKRNKWVKADCNSISLKYFICMNESDRALTSSTTLRSITIVTTTSGGPDSIMDSTPSNTRSGNTIPPAYIAAIITFVVVLALAVGLTVFFVFKKRRCRAKEHNYINDGLHNPSGKQQKDDDPEYDDVKMNDDDGDDVINPYGLTGGVSTRKNEVRHLEMPSGDLYALSSKQVNKPDKNKNTGDVNKNVEDVEELYAKPKKQRDLKPKASKDGKVNRNGTNLVGHLTSSDGSVSKIGQKHTEHFESPSGEVYATVTTE